MFGIGLPEMLLIGLVALVVLGPDRLPEAARNLGKAIADIRRATEPARTAWTEMTTEINTAITATGNPWTVHPIMEKMTPEERDNYMKGGDLPERIALELDQFERERAPTSAQAEVLEYPMPHDPNSTSTSRHTPVELEQISYPQPDITTKNN